jgi:phospholipase C
MPNKLNKVKHVVVLMLENRSFDHLLGYLKALGIKPAIDGLTGTETIPTDPVLGTGPVTVSPTAANTDPAPDAGHEIADVSRQFYAQVNLNFPPGGPMNGFIASYAGQSPAPANAGDIMKCVHPTRIPALAELATRFCVCDRWFASVPGSTWPNRMFAHAATSDGAVTNVFNLVFRPTVFDLLSLAGRQWRIYYHDLPQAALFASLFVEWVVSPITHRFRLFPQRWKKDLAGSRCRLPAYTFIEPRYFTLGSLQANDQHPSHSIARADRLVRDVYEPLRASPCWAHSMLVIVHDEHGGTYDHRFPDPPTVSPDGLSQMPPFNFTRYGARVPAVIVSPWASDGVCSDLYDHASIPATLTKRFGLSPLTARDQAANSLGGCLTRTQPRLSAAEAPLKLTAAALQLSRADRNALDPRRRPLSPVQSALVRLADHIRIPLEDRSKVRPLARIRTEQQGAEFVDERVRALVRATTLRSKPRARSTRRSARRGRRRAR